MCWIDLRTWGTETQSIDGHSSFEHPTRRLIRRVSNDRGPRGSHRTHVGHTIATCKPPDQRLDNFRDQATRIGQRLLIGSTPPAVAH